jgi:hypothetical protein
MSKPSEFLDNILDGILRLRQVPRAILDEDLLNVVEKELRDADRLIWEAVKAAHEKRGEVD